MQEIFGVLLSAVVVWAAPSGEDDGQIWAVLVAGSNQYYNYRHQADVCHAYQIFHRHGIPDSNIIVFMYDDIAFNPKNPRQGVIINKPGGKNVYGPKTPPKDYTKDQVTPENFINVLTGQKTANGSGKVLKSGPNDHVFVYFTDHGSTGLVGFPNGYLYATDLIKALKTMHEKKMFKKLVFYLEACHSGSMFENHLPDNINIFATTAAKPDEGSYSCYWDDTTGTFLGDEYSVAWMEDIDSMEHQKNMTTATLQIQFEDVLKRVSESHPQMYGDKQLRNDHLTDYIGASKDPYFEIVAPFNFERFQDSVSARDVSVHTLIRRLDLADSEEKRQALQTDLDNLLRGRKEVYELFSRIISHVTDGNDEDIIFIEEERQPLNVEMMSCYKTLVDTFTKECVNINKNTYTLGHLYKFANLCATQYTTADEVVEAMKVECGDAYKTMDGIH